jgi:hypothetical protein
VGPSLAPLSTNWLTRTARNTLSRNSKACEGQLLRGFKSHRHRRSSPAGTLVGSLSEPADISQVWSHVRPFVLIRESWNVGQLIVVALLQIVFRAGPLLRQHALQQALLPVERDVHRVG